MDYRSGSVTGDAMDCKSGSVTGDVKDCRFRRGCNPG